MTQVEDSGSQDPGDSAQESGALGPDDSAALDLASHAPGSLDPDDSAALDLGSHAPDDSAALDLASHAPGSLDPEDPELAFSSSAPGSDSISDSASTPTSVPVPLLPRRPEVAPPPPLRLPRRGDATPSDLRPPLPPPPPASDLRPPLPPPPPASDLRPPPTASDLRLLLRDASRHSRASWLGASPALRAALVSTPLFLRSLPGALLVPFRGTGLVSVAGAGLLLALALAGLLLSPRLAGLVAILAVSQAAALRLRTITEASCGRDDVTWPDLQDGLPALGLHASLAALFLPAALAGLLAWGPAAFEGPGSLPARARDGLFTIGVADVEVARLAAEAGETYEAAARRPAELTRAEREAVGVEVAPDAPRAPRAQPRPALAPAEPGDPVVAAGAWLRALLDPRAASSSAGAAARALLLAALLLHPMALLAAAKFQSAAAAWHLPLLLRSIVRAAPSYVLAAGLCLAADAALVVGVFVVRARLAPAGSLLSAGLTLAATSTAAVALQLVTGAALGRLYRTHRAALAWER